MVLLFMSKNGKSFILELGFWDNNYHFILFLRTGNI